MKTISPALVVGCPRDVKIAEKVNVRGVVSRTTGNFSAMSAAAFIADVDQMTARARNGHTPTHALCLPTAVGVYLDVPPSPTMIKGAQIDG